MLFNLNYKKDSKQHNCFTTIDELPIKIWFDVHKEGDISLIIKKGKIKKEDLVNIWDDIYNQYIKRFGVSEGYKKNLAIRKKIALLQADFIITGQRHYKTLINIEKTQLEEEKKEIEKPFELESMLAKISKFYGFKLNSRELTTTEYYSYLENITNG